MRVQLRRLPHGRGLPLPEPASPGSAGHDLRAALQEDLELSPGDRRLIPTGFALALPPGVEAQIRPRSGLALHHGITVANAPGTIDSDYRGEVGVILIHLGDEPLVLHRGDRIAQMVFSRVERAEIEEVSELPATERSDGGFGSTGRD